MDNLNRTRLEKDEFFRHSPQSPLTSQQKQSFTGLSYYPPNPGLRLELMLEKPSQSEPIEMQTSTGEVRVYLRIGRITFQVDGEEVHLTVFSDQHSLFLPFVDGGGGRETYGAGRYLEPEPLGKGFLLVDFNESYNPYCAYNENYSCPLTPWENRTSVAIRAGEKLPEGDWVEHPG